MFRWTAGHLAGFVRLLLLGSVWFGQAALGQAQQSNAPVISPGIPGMQKPAGSEPRFRPGNKSRTSAPLIDLQPADTKQATSEIWYIVLFGDERVGYERVTETQLQSGGQQNSRIRRRRDTQLALRKFGTDLSVSALQQTLENEEGSVLEWSLQRTAADGTTLERSGRWNSETSTYDVSELVQATRHEFRISSGSPARSSMITEWMPSVLTRQNRSISRFPVLFPETVAIADIEVRDKGSQTVRLQNGTSASARRFDFWPVIDQTRITTMYITEQGQVLRTEQPMLGSKLVFEPADAMAAMGHGNTKSLDLELASIIPIDRPLPNDENWQQVRLRMTVPSPGHLFLPSGRLQKAEQTKPEQVDLTIQSPKQISTSTFNTQASTQGAPEEYLAATRLLDIDNYEVQRMSRLAAGSLIDPDTTCRHLSAYLTVNLRRSAFSTSLAPASAIVKNMRGDCSEHAILLAALMRCNRIPSRVVTGLAYNPKLSGFTAHMWVEAWIDGDWKAFDSTTGTSAAAPVCIKVLDSSLADQNANAATLFLPLLDLMGRAKVKVLTESGF
ncbi:MAG: transglutaminase-like domain-containing protein [Planctomycetaceae bacterium]